MRETRKQIIELIEPYMDKTLSEGCYITAKYWLDDRNKLVRSISKPIPEKIIQIKGTELITKHNTYDRDYRDTSLLKKENRMYRRWDKNLGHYDVTAVLKYIIDKKGKILNNPSTFDIFCRDSKKHYGFIYNKPLHLYTDEEDKNLLKLLQKIGEK